MSICRGSCFKDKKRDKIPYVITEHSTGFARGLISSWQAKLIREVLKNADVKTVVSTKLGSLLENLFGADACPNYPIYNILDDRFVKEENILKGVKNDKGTFIFLNIAGLDPKKIIPLF